MVEYFFQCPYCWENVSILVDLSIKDQSYIEDCENCCNPILFHIITDNISIISFEIDEVN
ncbi:CPXCG motif-containing cysteine-rich protein [Aureivirga sp. CE67]|uniref:CPXCG motif-containing cysteine-rich protein n=1 Tax=Aureivirga sp. CE67 TaxID=1788983 RepID=UPI0018CB5257|nr:CPXCG motif-containing cysteine-rich protein [Aureivirga sp. CE67]